MQPVSLIIVLIMCLVCTFSDALQIPQRRLILAIMFAFLAGMTAFPTFCGSCVQEFWILVVAVVLLSTVTKKQASPDLHRQPCATLSQHCV
jgi:hypothetical protein